MSPQSLIGTRVGSISKYASTRDGFPEQHPGLATVLMCMPKKVQLHEVRLLEEEDLCFGEVGEDLVPESFLKTHRKALARLRSMAKIRTNTTRRTLTAEAKIKKMRRRLTTRTEAFSQSLGV